LEINLSQLINYERLNEHIRNLLVGIETLQEEGTGLCRLQGSRKSEGRELPGRVFGLIESFLVGPNFAVNVLAKQSSVGDVTLLPPTAEEVHPRLMHVRIFLTRKLCVH
jgi:hypothetical protein